ncbi:hypothetical protein CULT_220052 [[Clostridium] ultunense Esp]|nr:hypothetical protein CULT_220052 [[Clostridium] ultunense Esp]
MNFSLSEEQEMMRQMVREFAVHEVAPTASLRDEEERFDRKIFTKMAELGLTGIPWPERWGGAGADFLSYVIAVEELARVCASTAVTLSATSPWPVGRSTNLAARSRRRDFSAPWPKGKRSAPMV